MKAPDGLTDPECALWTASTAPEMDGAGPVVRSCLAGLAEERRQKNEALARARRAGQLLVEQIGAGGPEDVDVTAERAATIIKTMREALKYIVDTATELNAPGTHYEMAARALGVEPE